VRGVTLEKLDQLITEEVEKVKAEGVTESEFEKARNQKEAELGNDNGTMLARARNLANAHLFLGKTEEVNNELKRYLAVKREDLQRVAKKYFDPKKVHIVHYPVPAPPKLDAPSAPKEDSAKEQSEEDLRKRKRAVTPKAK
jgi:predicted Zn-dependent peptidase